MDVLPSIIIGATVATVISLVPVEKKLRTARAFMSLLGLIIGVAYADQNIHLGSEYGKAKSKNFLRKTDISEMVRIVPVSSEATDQSE